MNCPVISVLMGVYYKREDTELLDISISSILNQTFTDFELLICDDGSNEKAVRLIDDFAQKDSRVRVVRQGDLFLLPQKLNACLKAARGRFVARMDDDDYSYPQRFEKQLEFLNKTEDIAFAGCNVNLKRNGEICGKRVFPHYPTVEDFYFTQPFIHPTLIFRKDALLQVNGYSEEPHCILCEDYDLLLRLYEKGFNGANLQEILFDYTIKVSAKDGRKMSHRWNECVTRYNRFKALNVLPKAWPYVIKPLAVGMLPEPVLAKLKSLKERRKQIKV